LRHTGLDFSVAISAEQDALAGLSTELCDASGDTTETDDEGLLARVEVVELECAYIPVVATYRATATGFLNKDALYAPAPLADPLHGAGCTTVVVVLADPYVPRVAVMTTAA
jgi:hypothetical protein